VLLQQPLSVHDGHDGFEDTLQILVRDSVHKLYEFWFFYLHNLNDDPKVVSDRFVDLVRIEMQHTDKQVVYVECTAILNDLPHKLCNKVKRNHQFVVHDKLLSLRLKVHHHYLAA